MRDKRWGIPMKVILKLVFNFLLGGIALVLINLLGGIIGFGIALNPVSAFVAGTLGIPGIALLAILKYVLFS
jgi:inhibitor of the pro-sigma K processing machinery